jgi:phenylacetate-CoA ligase
LYLSVYHIAEDSIPFYLDALKSYQILSAYGYPAALYRLARHALNAGRRDVKLKVVVTAAEPLFDYQRRAISEAFQCPVRESYGMSEICAGASECEHGRLHLWPSAGVVEVLEGGQPVARGQSGDLVCTGLLNEDMPLIRYRLGDRGALAEGDEPCLCGRTLPQLASLDGRSTDVIYTPDGRFINRFETVFDAELPIREAQIIQETRSRLRVLFVPAAGFGEEHRSALVERVRQVASGMEIIPEAVEDIPRTASGKFRLVVCKLSDAQRAAFECGDQKPLGNA